MIGKTPLRRLGPLLQTTVPKRIFKLFRRHAAPAQPFLNDGSINPSARRCASLAKQFWHHVYAAFIPNKGNQRADKIIVHAILLRLLQIVAAPMQRR